MTDNYCEKAILVETTPAISLPVSGVYAASNEELLSAFM